MRDACRVLCIVDAIIRVLGPARTSQWTFGPVIKGLICDPIWETIYIGRQIIRCGSIDLGVASTQRGMGSYLYKPGVPVCAYELTYLPATITRLPVSAAVERQMPPSDTGFEQHRYIRNRRFEGKRWVPSIPAEACCHHQDSTPLL